MSDRVIELDGVTKVYHTGPIELEVLHGVTLHVNRGEYVAIMGPSGSGKSTLMNVIGCLDRATRGRYLLDGVDVSELDDNALAEIRLKKLGFVFQGFNLLGRANAIDNVALPLFYAGIRARERRDRAMTMLAAMGIADRARHKPAELSGGQQQRVAIARALVNDPAVLLADEPTGNLDSATSEELLQLFARLNDDGHTIIMVSHDEHVAGHARRIVRLRDGNVVSDDAAGKERLAASPAKQG
jgi:putative ABC transport system ATP-binding protein